MIDENMAFYKNHSDVVQGFYPCCGAFGVGTDGSLKLSTSEATARAFTTPFVQMGVTVHPVLTLNSYPLLTAAASPNSSFVADAVHLVQTFNFSGIALDYEGEGDYRVYSTLLKALSTALRGIHKEVVVCEDTSGVFNPPSPAPPPSIKAFHAFEEAGVDTQLYMSTYQWDFPGHESGYISLLLEAGVPPAQISMGVYGCPANYSSACNATSPGSADFTQARLRTLVEYTCFIGGLEIAVWPKAAWLDTNSFYFSEFRRFLNLNHTQDPSRGNYCVG